MTKQKSMTADELCDVLDELQESLERTPYPEEATVLKGSYGVYLHELRHKDPDAAVIYISWMREYNATRS